MKKQELIVPFGIRYISDWSEMEGGYNLDHFPFPHIVDKKIPGCGFTEYCLRNDMDLILCSPRKILLENKESQHQGEVFYFKNELDPELRVDIDLLGKPNEKFKKVLTDEELKKIGYEYNQVVDDLYGRLGDYIAMRRSQRLPVKILVTYDSFRHVRDFLTINMREIYKGFQVVVDEFQSAFVDSRFKSSTELEFLYHLQGTQRLCYVSATPMIDTYLDRLDEFKNLPYYELNWEKEDPLRVVKPDLKVRSCKSINPVACNIIAKYKAGEFEVLPIRHEDGSVENVESREAVFYVNSIKNICGIINKAGLTPEECNILCSNNTDNEKKLQAGLHSKKWKIGKVPLKGEPHKMFTFCTRTVYLGADFYSTNARTFVLSDANIDSLAVDITLDLPQIMGRQRLHENPWKNRGELYYKLLGKTKEQTRAEFEENLRRKIKATNNLLGIYDKGDQCEKSALAKRYKMLADSYHYREDFLAVNSHAGSDLVPVFNNLVMIAEERAYDIQQIDYKDRFAVFSQLANVQMTHDTSNKIIQFLEEFDSLKGFTNKMRLLCESDLLPQELDAVLSQIHTDYSKYYMSLGPERCKAQGYNVTRISKEYNDAFSVNRDNLAEEIYNTFQVGEAYSRSDVKEKLSDIFQRCNVNKSPKATILDEYFETVNKITTLKDRTRVNLIIIKSRLK